MSATYSSSDALLRTSVQDYMRGDVPKVRDNAPLEQALEEFKKSTWGVLYTVDDAGKLSGVITACDLVKLNAPEKPQTARDLATTEKIIGVKQNAELWQALKIMNGENAIQKTFLQLPVLSDKFEPVGIINRNVLRDRLSEVRISNESVTPSASGMYFR